MTIIHSSENKPDTIAPEASLSIEEIRELLEQMFMAEMNLSPEKFKQVIDYVLTGEGETALEQLKFNDLKFEKSGCQIMYDQIFDVLDFQQIIRLSKLVNLFIEEKRYVRTCMDDTCAPEEMKMLIYHALSVTSYDILRTNNRDNWTFQRMVDTFKSVDDTDNNIEKFVIDLFLRRYIETKPIDGSEFLSRHADIVNDTLTTLSQNDLTLFLEDTVLAYPDFFEKQPDTLSLLIVNSDKKIRKLALKHIGTIPAEIIQLSLKKALRHSTVKTSPWIIDALIATGDGYIAVMEDVAAELDSQSQSTSKKVSDIIKKRLSFFDVDVRNTFYIPDFQPLELTQIPASFIKVMKQNALEIYEQKKQKLEQLTADETSQYDIDRAQYHYKSWASTIENIDKICQETLDGLNGLSGRTRDIRFKEIALHNDSVQKLEEYGLLQAFMLSDLKYHFRWSSVAKYITPKLLEGIDLRHLLQVLSSIEDATCENEDKRDTTRDIAGNYLYKCSDGYNLGPFSDPEKILPFFITYPELIAEALGIKSAKFGYSFDFAKALELLSLFPQIPEMYIPKLLEIALNKQKTLRFESQEVLSRVPNIHLQAINALKDKTPDVRLAAVSWLGRLGQANQEYRPDIIKALHTLMKKEKKEAIIAAVLSSLEKNKDDISVFLTPETLLKSAKKGLKSKLSKTFEWFDFEALPYVYWQNGDKVDRQIIKWWIVLAEKLKTPQPNQLLQRYMSLLDDASQRKLSLYILQTFIDYDTTTYNSEEAKNIADGNIDNWHSDYAIYGLILDNYYCIANTWTAQYPDMPVVPEKIVYEHILAQLQRRIKGTAIKSKGMLALAHKATGSIALELLNKFVKDHYRRTAQINALLEAFSVSDDPLIIQWILSIARRHRTKSIQENANNIITQIAKRNNWTAEQLADRTIPLAGVDTDGILRLDYDSRTLTAYIDDKYKFVLQNEAGKMIKSLPAPKESDDKQIIKEAKSLFSASKKELKQMIELQTARLYEAMCCERLWSVADWQDYLFNHPIMRRLVARLVWLEVDTDGKVVQVFRPSNDGSLLNLDDDEVTVNLNNQIKLAHRIILDSDTTKACRQHLKDYEIKPLFSQFEHDLPNFDGDETKFSDYLGYAINTFKLRSLVTKLGYKRGVIGDGGGFKNYIKPYDSLGLVVMLNISGSDVPEQDRDVFLLSISFTRDSDSSWSPTAIPLSKVPSILLAESFVEYGKIAKNSSGFDPDWKRKAL